MLSGAIQSSTIPVLEQVVNFAQQRHAVLAGNLANIDTPGYHTRDLSPEVFQARLRGAIKQREQQHTPLSQASMSTSDPFAEATHNLDGILFHDDNNRSLEQQISAIADNELQHNMALGLLTKQYQLLNVAISERA
jgi:flagellar basal-body rod protein FlgB